jgi:hypothetical protein
MSHNDGNKREEKKPYAKPMLTVEGKAGEFTSVGKTNAKNGGSAKKSYTKPTLTTYGTIRDLTKQVGGSGSLDGGSLTGMTKTQLP